MRRVNISLTFRQVQCSAPFPLGCMQGSQMPNVSIRMQHWPVIMGALLSWRNMDLFPSSNLLYVADLQMNIPGTPPYTRTHGMGTDTMLSQRSNETGQGWACNVGGHKNCFFCSDRPSLPTTLLLCVVLVALFVVEVLVGSASVSNKLSMQASAAPIYRKYRYCRALSICWIIGAFFDLTAPL